MSFKTKVVFLADTIVSVRMPASLVKELKVLAKINHYLDVSEEVRSFIRDRWADSRDPYRRELKRIRKKAKEMSIPNKVNLLKTNLKRLLEELDEI